MEHGHDALGDRHEREPEEPLGHEEHAVAESVELEIGRDLGLVEVILRLADLLGVIAVVPRSDLDAGGVGVGEGLHVGDFLANPGDCRLPDGLHQFDRPLGRLGHRVFESPVGVGREPQELRPLRPQGEDLRHRRLVVGGVSLVAAADEHPPYLFPQVAPVGERQKRLHARSVVGNRPAARLAALLRRLGGGMAGRLGEAREVGFGVKEDGGAILLLEHVLGEQGGQLGELLVDRGEFGLFTGPEPGAGAGEVCEQKPRGPALLG